jgi:uncharacterized phage infection (PIP) family protein YhgE
MVTRRDQKKHWNDDEIDEDRDDNKSDSDKTREDQIEKLLRTFDRVEPMMEQLNTLYNQYKVGLERIPPNHIRKQLDELFGQLVYAQKPTAAYLYRYNTLYHRYNSYKEKWDKLVKDVESGKIIRTAGPKKPTRAF